jgi:hypothetical protein
MESFSRKPTLSASLLPPQPSHLFDASHDSDKKYRSFTTASGHTISVNTFTKL